MCATQVFRLGLALSWLSRPFAGSSKCYLLGASFESSDQFGGLGRVARLEPCLGIIPTEPTACSWNLLRGKLMHIVYAAYHQHTMADSFGFRAAEIRFSNLNERI
jgi:hypothetical protein